MLIVASALLALGACSGIDWPRGIYEGVRQRQKAPAVPDPGPARQPAPDYDQYRRERDALKPQARAPVEVPSSRGPVAGGHA